MIHRKVNRTVVETGVGFLPLHLDMFEFGVGCILDESSSQYRDAFFNATFELPVELLNFLLFRAFMLCSFGKDRKER